MEQLINVPMYIEQYMPYLYLSQTLQDHKHLN